MRYKNYFFPPAGGVAFSHNLYRWTDRIDPNQGIIRLVFGLGTRAVNRVGGDYPAHHCPQPSRTCARRSAIRWQPTPSANWTSWICRINDFAACRWPK
jgi:hypothetical protein